MLLGLQGLGGVNLIMEGKSLRERGIPEIQLLEKSMYREVDMSNAVDVGFSIIECHTSCIVYFMCVYLVLCCFFVDC